jgi:hypothetical protein
MKGGTITFSSKKQQGYEIIGKGMHSKFKPCHSKKIILSLVDNSNPNLKRKGKPFAWIDKYK